MEISPGEGREEPEGWPLEEQPRGPGQLPGCLGTGGATSEGAGGSRAGASEMPTERAHDVAGASAHIPAPSPAKRGAATAVPQTLPLDLLLEIVARSDDAATVVRCAMVSRSLRRALLGPQFPPALALRAAASGGFHPAHLVAVSSYWMYQRADDLSVSATAVHTSRCLPFDAGLLRWFKSASSRDGRLVLWRDRIRLGSEDRYSTAFEVDLRVCSAFSGHVTSLPRMVLRRRLRTGDMFPPALLAVDGARRSSFELLVMESSVDHGLKAHTFSSQKGEWGDVREIHLPQGVSVTEATYTAPAVIGRTIRWLCVAWPGRKLVVRALHAEAAQVMVIELPEDCRARMGNTTRSDDRDDRFILAVAADGTSLRLVVTEDLVISMWTPSQNEGPSSSNSWSRQVVIRRREIDRTLTAGVDAYRPIRFNGYGESSGVVLFWMKRVGLVQLSLGTKKALVLKRCGEYDHFDTAKALLHEIDLVRLLQGMKIF